ncbi:hypothetical protein [Nonomuraea sp. NPDC052265]|uniref:hypothetical protein n=1 Tax=Nonomuraea sp. NPDC052265 TaxID=3364374 RepID=UPI0037CC310A
MLTDIRMPPMTSIMQRWVQSCRHELLDRCLGWNERHLRAALSEHERFRNRHPRPGLTSMDGIIGRRGGVP